jgi:hypothetical protein
MMITWKNTDADFPAPWTTETKIQIFHDRTLGWQIHIAELVANGGKHLNGKTFPAIPDSGFAVLQICLSYFETIGKYMDGYAQPGGQSKHYFEEGVKAVFPSLNTPASATLLGNLYEDARCGLYHGSMTVLGIRVGENATDAVVYDAANGTITLNPHKLPKALGDHLAGYVRKLRDAAETDLRRKFEARFDMEYPPATPATPATLAPPPGADTEISGPMAAPVPLTPAPTRGGTGASGIAPGTTRPGV